ncbi:MAG TPA: hypothetical protein VKA34_14695 [Balneolales bacterium]|nr:hypothetical protein [Balneolales bacterium]
MKLIVNDLLNKVSDYESLTQKEQVKLISFFHCLEFDTNFFTKLDIKNEFDRQALSQPSNLSREVSKLISAKPPIFVSNGQGLKFHRFAKKELEETYLGAIHNQQVSTVLRELLEKIKGDQQKSFLEEAINCFEIKSYRAAVMLTWLLAMDILYEFILIPDNLKKFNTAIHAHGKYKKLNISIKENFSDIKESDFIELLRVAKLISKDRRKILDEKLGIRNTCAHPNSIIIKEYKAISFIQDLVTNIITQYQ